MVHGHAELGRGSGSRGDAGFMPIPVKVGAPGAAPAWLIPEQLGAERTGKGRARPPFVCRHGLGSTPRPLPSRGSVPEYTVPGHRHAHLELGEQTLPDVTHISRAEIREFEVYEGQTHCKLSIESERGEFKKAAGHAPGGGREHCFAGVRV